MKEKKKNQVCRETYLILKKRLYDLKFIDKDFRILNINNQFDIHLD